MLQEALLLSLAMCVFLVAYAYVLYPFGMYVLALFANERKAEWDELPTVTLLIAAYNEEEIIAEKIENSLALEYPAEKLDIIVFSDASSDATDDIVRSYADEGVELRRIEGRVGKTECQNQVVADLDTEIIVFSDANGMYDSDAIGALVSKFTPDVGCVIGAEHLSKQGANTGGLLSFRSYERFILAAESAVGSVTKGNGAIYAVRRDEYVPIAPDILSDFAEPLSIKEKGLRVAFAADAISREGTRDDPDAEQTAINRVTTRSWHTLWAKRNLLNPFRYGFYSLQLWSRTVILWLTPVLLILLTANVIALAALFGGVLVQILAAGLVAYLLVLTIASICDTIRVDAPSLAQTALYHAQLNYGMLVGLWNFIHDENIVTWETDKRQVGGD